MDYIRILRHAKNFEDATSNRKLNFVLLDTKEMGDKSIATTNGVEKERTLDQYLSFCMDKQKEMNAEKRLDI